MGPTMRRPSPFETFLIEFIGPRVFAAMDHLLKILLGILTWPIVPVAYLTLYAYRSLRWLHDRLYDHGCRVILAARRFKNPE